MQADTPHATCLMKVIAAQFNTTGFTFVFRKFQILLGILEPFWIPGILAFFVSKCKVEVRPLAQGKLGNKKEKGGSLIGDDEKMLPSL